MGSYAFIPKRLEIEDQKDLENFPLNIMFGTFDKNATKISIYEPVLETYQNEGGKQFLLYKNKFGENDWLTIAYYQKTGRYESEKYVKDKLTILTDGSDKNWQKTP